MYAQNGKGRYYTKYGRIIIIMGLTVVLESPNYSS